ncbi:MAG TPA: protein ndvB, partial [Steroidobacteraceae bacterium]|nr:protein ndvB [Steroidobacteraceae bacterium]
MKVQLRNPFKAGSPTSPWNTDALIREELFSIERLEQHAVTLAAAQSITTKPLKRPSLNARLLDNETILLAAYRGIGAAVNDGQAITPAAEWLIDNYHLVEEQIRQIKDDLPPRFYKQLPKLASGPFTGYPRVFGLTWACVAHTDSHFDSETLRRFVHAYQRVQPLTIGELWAIAITLRVVLVENLRRAADGIVKSRLARREADRVADELLGSNGSKINSDALVLHQQANGDLSSVFVVQLVQRLRDQDPRVTPALAWLENRISAHGSTIEQVVHDEHQRQSTSNVTVRNIITSMRLISDVHWPEFFEAVSLVDEALCATSDFANMDFATRNLYRSVIEQLSRGSKHSELEVTHEVIAAINRHKQITNDNDPAFNDSKRDPGYYLLTGGRRAFEQSLGYRASLRRWPSRFSASMAPSIYISTVLFVAAIILTVPVYALHASLSSGDLLLLTLCGIVPALDLGMALVNRMVTREFGATMLPALALRNGVPQHLRTMVVVPVLLTTAESIEVQIERLEVLHLASSSGEVYFALLSDWTDAATEKQHGDDDLLEVAVKGIERLNRIHEPLAGNPRFYLLHRRRVWSAVQRQWMGWERKRGKLHELNRLLRGDTGTTFINPDLHTPQVPSAVRYVITLDADTRLPREAVRRLVGKMAHPLNHPRFDTTSRRIVEGYAILQPRVTPSLPVGREGSLFQRVFSSMTGIDAYDAAVSDVYQDLFGEGSYAGKGIYDVDAFEAALTGRVPDGSLLSHDLFEGTFARSGLVSDIEVVEEFPSRYDVAAARTHRWARGDWQLLPWITNRRSLVNGAGNRKNSLPPIARWKMLDNLRRTLSAPAVVIALLVGWTLPIRSALLWTAFLLTTIALPILLPALNSIVPRHRGISVYSHLRAFRNDVYLAALQILFTIMLVVDQACLMADAICRTLFRLLISKRNLLEWVTAAQAQLNSRLTFLAVYRRMLASVCIAIAVMTVSLLYQTSTRWLALPFALLWLVAPAIAKLISVSPLVAGRVSVSIEESKALRFIARRTWRYFETFVTHSNHMLPPDNFQEDPQHVIAHRTSPTNLGLYLLSTVSAHDFGWIGVNETVERLEATMATMQRLPRHRGHFYNWYDTHDLRALEPRYVSTVDSGNLAAHLIAVANACQQWSEHRIVDTTFATSAAEALHFTSLALKQIPDTRRNAIISHEQLQQALGVLDQALNQFTTQSNNSEGHLAIHTISELDSFIAHAAIVVDTARALANERNDDAHDDLLFWAEAANNTLMSWHRDVHQPDSARRVLQQRLLAIEAATRAMALAMEFGFLLDPERKLLSIGYLVPESTLDSSCYDLLASEARLASFFAIAKNDVATRHWFRLGRAVTAVGHGAALISWSGSMFEYLMPSLVVRAPVGSLLEQTSR